MSPLAERPRRRRCKPTNLNDGNRRRDGASQPGGSLGPGLIAGHGGKLLFQFCGVFWLAFAGRKDTTAVERGEAAVDLWERVSPNTMAATPTRSSSVRTARDPREVFPRRCFLLIFEFLAERRCDIRALLVMYGVTCVLHSFLDGGDDEIVIGLIQRRDSACGRVAGRTKLATPQGVRLNSAGRFVHGGKPEA